MIQHADAFRSSVKLIHACGWMCRNKHSESISSQVDAWAQVPYHIPPQTYTQCIQANSLVLPSWQGRAPTELIFIDACCRPLTLWSCTQLPELSLSSHVKLDFQTHTGTIEKSFSGGNQTTENKSTSHPCLSAENVCSVVFFNYYSDLTSVN